MSEALFLCLLYVSIHCAVANLDWSAPFSLCLDYWPQYATLFSTLISLALLFFLLDSPEISRFIKRWSRGYNTCSRCDFEYAPARNTQPLRRSDDRQSQSSRQLLPQNQQQQAQGKATALSSSLIKEIKEEKKPDVREVKDVRRDDRVKARIESFMPALVSNFIILQSNQYKVIFVDILCFVLF